MSKRFSDQEAVRGWNQGAAAWREFVRSGADYYRHYVHGPALLRACGSVRGLRALDLGCGEGYFARQLARAGAQVTAVDISEGLLEYARADEAREPLGIEYVQLSATEIGARFAPATFDIATGCMSLQDMSDVSAVLRDAHTVLQEDGRFVFSVPHPATDMPAREWERNAHGRKLALKVGRYFETGPAVMDWTMRRLAYQWSTPFWRHTLEQWSELIGSAGFVIQRMFEPRPTEEQVAAEPALADCRDLPYFLIFDLRRA